MQPYVNDNASLKTFTHTSLTAAILFGAFFIGYSYARLSRDEYTRRLLYNRYSNAMQMFDSFAGFYEPIYDKIKSLILNFDSTYEMWRMR